ncbi:MAG: hypothetical protein VKN56_11540 [Cyanobacteriota bacterium]|nr:hypothetical protein [Cyanobacteriota bacterium]
MGNIEEGIFPCLIRWPGTVEAKKAGLCLTILANATAPADHSMWRSLLARSSKQSLDAAAGNQRPATGSDDWANESFVAATVADQTPFNLDRSLIRQGMQASGCEWNLFGR